MVRMKLRFLLLFAAATLARAQPAKVAEIGRPPLFFREDFKETPAATPITQGDIKNANLVLALYSRPGRHEKESP